MLARVIAIATCLSLCLSVTRQYCVKKKKASVMISSPSGTPRFYFSDAKFHLDSLRVSPSGSLKQGWGGKFHPFSSFKDEYLENVSSSQGQNALSIDTKIDDLELELL